jgi:hypothetical protein
MTKTKTIYWAIDDSADSKVSWNMLYEDPENLYDLLKNNQNKKENNNFFRCPSFINFAKNVFVLKNPLNSSFKISNGQVFPTSETYINSKISHNPSINNNTLFIYGLHLYFFSENKIDMSISSPFFQKADHLQYGAIVPGKINIGSWFRRVNLEFNLWDNIDEIKIKEGEPIAYFQFQTEQKVILKRFVMNDLLYKIAESTGSSSIWEPRVSLQKRYQRFINSKTDLLVLKEIEKNTF